MFNKLQILFMILVGDYFNKGFKASLKLTHDDSRARTSRSHLALDWSQALWIVFGSSRLGEGVLQEDLDLCLVCLDHV